MLHRGKMLTAHRCSTYPPAMEQVQARAMSKTATAKDRVDSALSRLESMVEERLRTEADRAEELAKRLTKLERQHDDLTWDDVSQRVIEWMRIDVERVHWFSTYRVHHRVSHRLSAQG